MNFLSILLQANIDDKIKNAPDNGYLVGVWIGYLLPFVIFAGLAYYMYYRAKKRKDENNF
jgi:hypothetical protein